MTHDEEQHLGILHVMVTKGIERIRYNDSPEEIRKITGEGYKKIVIRMLEEGLLSNVIEIDGFELTTAGRTKYQHLKRKKRNEKIKGGIGWITLVAAVISALYGVLSYYWPPDSNQKREMPVPKQEYPAKRQSHPSIPDTMKAHHPKDTLKGK